MTTLIIKVPENKTTRVSAYVKKMGGEVVAGKNDEAKAGKKVSQSLAENELNVMSLAYAEKAFSSNWDVDDQKANEYWDSF